MIAVSMKSQHPHLHNSDPNSSDNASLSAANTPPNTVTQKQPQSSTTTNTMLAVAPPSIPPSPILNTNGVQKRPKLSLQTSCLPVTFGNSTTGLSLNHSASCSPSPTVKNTFRNAYDAYRHTPSPAPTLRAEPCTKDPKPTSKQEALPANYSRHSHDELPYQLPLGIRGILRNSPIVASSLRRASLSATSVNGSGNGRRALFPAKKRVHYRCPIDEEIKTVRFIAKHSDLTSPSGYSCSSSSASSSSSSEGESASDSSESSGASDEDSTSTHKETGGTSSPGKRKKHARSMRQIRAAGLRDRVPCPDDDVETPQTPVNRRRKRQRQWRWTLGPIKDGHVLPSRDDGSNAAVQETDPQPASLAIQGGKSPGVNIVIPMPVPIQSRPKLSPVSPGRGMGRR
ncbi:conserved hypothetical protein [Coccidioides posadasii str. Silveira]|uniref:Uncharacterized protein n=1 Tax=Coccidioides posadasii (strain RMSCC 757 / Silveira) TaxID=443226 RepID=E9CW32_COCPS|nr:conserved hypothetical protein [Coccidioides posadasii str. Silveira]